MLSDVLEKQVVEYRMKSLVLVGAGLACFGASLFGQKRARWLALGGGVLVGLAAWAEADPVLGLGGLSAALAVWLSQRAGPRRGVRGLEPRPDTPLAETFRKLP